MTKDAVLKGWRCLAIGMALILSGLTDRWKRVHLPPSLSGQRKLNNRVQTIQPQPSCPARTACDSYHVEIRQWLSMKQAPDSVLDCETQKGLWWFGCFFEGCEGCKIENSVVQ